MFILFIWSLGRPIIRHSDMSLKDIMKDALDNLCVGWTVYGIENQETGEYYGIPEICEYWRINKWILE